MLITRGTSYEQVYDAFAWRVPEYFNIAEAACDRHAADPNKVALIHEQTDGQVRTYTFRDFQNNANRFANVLTGLGLKKGDRVAIMLGQDPEAAIAHLACWKAGLISIPVSCLFGPDAIEYRLNDCGAKVVLTDLADVPKVLEVRQRTPSLEAVFLIDGRESGAENFWTALKNASDRFTNVPTLADDPAVICYTSGTTGAPKGALHAHRILLGHMPGVEFHHNFFPQPDDLVWSPADWAWLAGLWGILMTAWFHGVPVLAHRGAGFDPEFAFHLMGKHRVRNALLVPTMLKMMRQVPNPHRFDINLRTAISGAEAVGVELFNWMKDTLDIVPNEVYGQTECNLCLVNCAEVMPSKPGSLGRPTPGKVTAIVDDAGQVASPGTIGHIAVKRPNPVMLLEYWNKPDATRDKYIGDWLITGDLGQMDDDGYFWFHGRSDDVITSSGYRIGPGEIEDAILRHPAVALAAAVGVPDPERTEVIKAFIVPADGHQGSDTLENEIREMVKSRLAKHEYPKMIEFVDALPMTTTGKIQRNVLRAREQEKSGKKG